MQDNTIMVVQQLPIITERLASVKALVDDRVGACAALACTEDTVKAVKKFRAELKAEFLSYEHQRKAIKAAVMEPYEAFEKIYKECVADAYIAADLTLKEKIGTVEDGVKAEKSAEVQRFFEELCEASGIDFVIWEQASITVTLSASMKSLKDQATAFVQRIKDDLTIIEAQEHRTDILVEYKRTLNCAEAIATVNARHKAIAEELAKQKAAEAAQQAAAIPDPPRQEPLQAPDIAEPPVAESTEPVYTLSFKVRATLPKLKALKQFLNENHYEIIE